MFATKQGRKKGRNGSRWTDISLTTVAAPLRDLMERTCSLKMHEKLLPQAALAAASQILRTKGETEDEDESRSIHLADVIAALKKKEEGEGELMRFLEDFRTRQQDTEVGIWSSVQKLLLKAKEDKEVAKRKDTENEELKCHIATMKAEMEKWRLEAQAPKTSHENIQAATIDLQSIVTSQKKEIHELKAQLGSKVALLEDLSKCKAELEAANMTMEKEKLAISKDFDLFKKHTKDNVSKLSFAIQKKDEEHVKLKTTEKELRDSLRSHDTLVRTTALSEKENQRLKEELFGMETQKRELETENANLLAQIHVLELEQKKMQHNKASTDERLVSLNQELQDARAEIAKQQEARVDLSKEHEESIDEIHKKFEQIALRETKWKQQIDEAKLAERRAQEISEDLEQRLAIQDVSLNQLLENMKRKSNHPVSEEARTNERANEIRKEINDFLVRREEIEHVTTKSLFKRREKARKQGAARRKASPFLAALPAIE